jgi:hypothetical protein
VSEIAFFFLLQSCQLCLCGSGYDCVKNNGTTGCQPQSSFCNLCQMSVGLVIDKGCTAACAALSGPLAWVCGFLLEFVGCQKLIEFISCTLDPSETPFSSFWFASERYHSVGETPNKICHQVGLCGTACPCGRCSRLTPDSCLGLPARCPKNNTMFNGPHIDSLLRPSSKPDSPHFLQISRLTSPCPIPSFASPWRRLLPSESHSR